MNVQNILNQFNQSSLIRPNRFIVLIDYSIEELNLTEQLNLLCSATVIPGKQIFTSEYRIDRNLLRKPYTYQFEPIQMTFLLPDYKVKTFFDAWMNRVIDPKTYTVGWLNDYANTIRIHALDSRNNIRYGVRLINAFPTAISNLEYSNEADGIVSIDVTFVFDEVEQINSTKIKMLNAAAEFLRGRFTEQGGNVTDNAFDETGNAAGINDKSFKEGSAKLEEDTKNFFDKAEKGIDNILNSEPFERTLDAIDRIGEIHDQAISKHAQIMAPIQKAQSRLNNSASNVARVFPGVRGPQDRLNGKINRLPTGQDIANIRF